MGPTSGGARTSAATTSGGAHTSAATTSSGARTSGATTSGGTHTAVSGKNKLPKTATSLKGKAKSVERGSSQKKSPSTPGSKKPPSAPGSKQSTVSKPSLSTSSLTPARANTPSSTAGGPAKCTKPPVNFQELMKLAEQKKSMESTGLGGGECVAGPGGVDGGVVSGKRTVRTDGVSGERSGRGEMRRSKSPLGKQLLEKTSSRLKQKTVDGGRERVSEEKMVGRSGSEPGDSTKGSRDPVVGRSTVGPDLRELAQSRIVGRGSKTVSSMGGGRGRRNGGDCSAGRGQSQPLPESAVLIRERFRRELEASANGSKTSTKTTSVKSNSFYGSAHAQLSKEGKPSFAVKRPSVAGPYQSSWAREMTEYVEKLREGDEEGEGYSDEDDDSLNDFVVDDEEGNDVSSAIREIFGYDKGR